MVVENFGPIIFHIEPYGQPHSGRAPRVLGERAWVLEERNLALQEPNIEHELKNHSLSFHGWKTVEISQDLPVLSFSCSSVKL